MLTRTIKLRLTRSIIRPKSLSTSTTSHPVPLPPLTSLHLPETPSQPFPLYQPPTPSSSSSSTSGDRSTGIAFDKAFSADNLPTDKALQRRVKLQLTRAVEKDLEEYTEDDLRGFYAAVVQSGIEGAGPSRSRRISGREGDVGKSRAIGDGREERGLVKGVAERLNTGLSENSLISRKEEEGEREVMRSVIDTLGRFASEDEDNVGGSSTGLSRISKISLGLLSGAEIRALLYETVKVRDPASLADLLEILPRIGASIEREYIVSLLDGLLVGDARTWAARDGKEQNIIAILAGLVQSQESLLPVEQDTMIRLNLITDPSATAAIAHLRTSETLSHPAPESSYNLVLSHLTASSPTSATRALAWDLFTHMRLVAHPSPSQAVYRTMIASCAASTEPKPEMARDLWIQMTQEQKLDPAEPDYTAYILALCSTKSTYLEGFDVFRQMLARHNDATYIPFQIPGKEIEGQEGISEFLPASETWKALLEGAKRAGDLARTRWVLSECVRLHTILGGKGVDEDIMSSVFMAYAAWRPTLKRAAVREQVKPVDQVEDRTTQQVAGMEGEQEDIGSDEREQLEYTDIEPRDYEGGTGMFADHLPITSTEAIHEASLLFDAITSANTPLKHDQSSDIFTGLRLTARLINSYLSVIYAHASSVAKCRKAWEDVWSRVSVEKNGWSYLHALERCSAGQRGRPDALQNRQQALDWAKQLWVEYQGLSPILIDHVLRSAISDPGLSYSLGISPRQIERSWRAIIRSHSLHNETDEALSLLFKFYDLYPPRDILRSYSPLTSHGFSVRFSDPTNTAESHVPPHILFKDVDVLHQRLVRDEKWDQVGRVKWICQSYEGALAKRRKWRLTGAGRWRERREKIGLEQSGRLEQGDTDGAVLALA